MKKQSSSQCIGRLKSWNSLSLVSPLKENDPNVINQVERGKKALDNEHSQQSILCQKIKKQKPATYNTLVYKPKSCILKSNQLLRINKRHQISKGFQNQCLEYPKRQNLKSSSKGSSKNFNSINNYTKPSTIQNNSKYSGQLYKKNQVSLCISPRYFQRQDYCKFQRQITDHTSTQRILVNKKRNKALYSQEINNLNRFQDAIIEQYAKKADQEKVYGNGNQNNAVISALRLQNQCLKTSLKLIQEQYSVISQSNQKKRRQLKLCRKIVKKQQQMLREKQVQTQGMRKKQGQYLQLRKSLRQVQQLQNNMMREKQESEREQQMQRAIVNNIKRIVTNQNNLQRLKEKVGMLLQAIAD